MGEADGDWADKAEEERLGIIAKYDKGREEGAQIDPWEDPAFEIYHSLDHYGFIHDTRFPVRFNLEENKVRELEALRADKWIKMYTNWEKFKNSEKVRKRTFKGIPNKVRGLFWGVFLEVPTAKLQQQGKYEEMCQLARKHSLDVRQIDLDVNRTYRDHIMFRERYGVKQQSLFNILCAYSVYNSEVGYCQGMSQVAALLLVYMPEEDAFWGLSQLMTHHKYGMHGFFIAGFPKLVRFQRHHDKVLKAMLPKLKKHLDKHGVDVGLYTLKWFFQCFLDRVPFELALRLWDVFVMDGDRVLICGAYTILKYHQRELLARKNMDDLLDYIQSKIPSDLTKDNDKIMELYQRCSEELHKKKLATGGDPGEDELPKRPFGLIENIVKPDPVRKETPDRRIKIDRRSEAGSEAGDMPVDEEEEFDDISEKASASRVTVTSAASSSHHSPHNYSRPLSSVSNFSYASAIEDYNSPSNKSTPLKINGISTSTKHKTASSSEAKNSYQVAHNDTGTTNISKLEEHIGNGRIEFIEDSMENLNVLENVNTKEPVKQTVELDYSGVGSNNSSLRRDMKIRGSPDKAMRNVKAPLPPSRSPEPSHVLGEGMNSQKMFQVNSTKVTTNVLETSHRVMESEIIVMKNEEIGTRKFPVSPLKISLNAGAKTEVVLSTDQQYGPSSLSKNIPGGETVRIHVPYSSSTTSSDISNSPATLSNTTVSSRTNFDALKNDPNRIKIDISSK